MVSYEHSAFLQKVHFDLSNYIRIRYTDFLGSPYGYDGIRARKKTYPQMEWGSPNGW